MLDRKKFVNLRRTASAFAFGSSVLACLLSFAANARAQADHEDPPGPPVLNELVYLHSLKLTTDQDDGFLFFDGDTEINIKVTVTQPGHGKATAFFEIEDIDMDGPLSDNYNVLDGTLTAPERKGGKLFIYGHNECCPPVPCDFTIQVSEVDTSNIGDIVAAVAKAGGALSSTGQILGGTLVGSLADKLGAAVDGVLAGATNLGSNSGPVGNTCGGCGPCDEVKDWIAPTINFEYKPEFIVSVGNPLGCTLGSSNEKDTQFDLEHHNGLDSGFYENDLYELMGFDEKHPFTKNNQTALTRGTHLHEALDDVDLLAVEGDGANPPPDIAGQKAILRAFVREIPRDTLLTEMEEGIAGGIPPAILAIGQAYLTQGDVDVLNGQDHAAIDHWLTGTRILLSSNHPDFGTWANFVAEGLEGSFGQPVLWGTGALNGGTPFELGLVSARPFAAAFLIVGLSTLGAPFKGGTLVPSPDVLVGPLPVNATGRIVLAGLWPVGLPPGLDWFFQYWVQDPFGPKGYSASNSLMAISP